MSNVTKTLIISVDVLLVCLLISLIFRNYQLTSQLAKIESESLIKTRTEYSSTDISAMESVAIPGTTVINAVRKYLPTLDIEILRETGSVELSAGESFSNVMPDNSVCVDPDKLYDCERIVNVNNVMTGLRFKPAGYVSETTDYSLDSFRRSIATKMEEVYSGALTKSYSALLSDVNECVDARKFLQDLAHQENGTSSDLNTIVTSKILELTNDNANLTAAYSSSYGKSVGSFSVNGTGEHSIGVTNTEVLVVIGQAGGLSMKAWVWERSSGSTGHWYGNNQTDLAFDSSTGKLSFPGYSGLGIDSCTFIAFTNN